MKELTEALQKLPIIYCSFSMVALLTFRVGEFSVMGGSPVHCRIFIMSPPSTQKVPVASTQSWQSKCLQILTKVPAQHVEGRITFGGWGGGNHWSTGYSSKYRAWAPQLHLHIYTCTISTLLNVVPPRRPYSPAFLSFILASIAYLC